MVDWAEFRGQRWAISRGNAGARYGRFFNDLKRLSELNWGAIEALEWRDPFVNEGKQAEFLLFGSFPWTMVERIGVIDETRAGEVQSALATATYKPPIVVQRNWYY